MQTMSATNPKATAANATGITSSRFAGRTSKLSAGNSGELCSPEPSGLRLRRLRPRVFKVRNLPEQLEALFDLLAGHVLQSLCTEPLNRKRSHHSTIEHRCAEDGRRQLRLRGKIAVKAASKRITSARWIHHFGQWQRWCPEGMQSSNAPRKRPVSKESRCAVFAMLHNQCLRSHGQYLISR